MTLALQLTPKGHLQAVDEPEAPLLDDTLAGRLREAFARGTGEGLLHLGAVEVTTALPSVWSFWRNFARQYVTALTATPEDDAISVSPPEGPLLESLSLDAPPMTGGEYLSPDVLTVLWTSVEEAAKAELAVSGQTLQTFLKSKHPAWNLVGRVHFNLAENRKDPECPFAFLATYTSRLSAHGKAQHLPLSQALAEFSGGKKKNQLLSLLLPVQRAAENCDWMAMLVAEGDIYHPLRWDVRDAVRFLRDVPKLESAGIVVRMPKTWAANRPARPKVSAKVGGKSPVVLGMDALLDFQVEITLDGQSLSPEEVKALLANSEGLQWVRGQWVEVDRDRMATLLARFAGLEEAHGVDGLPFAQSMRLLAGTAIDGSEPVDPDWSEIVSGKWLSEWFRMVRSPENLSGIDPGLALKATLRPYQLTGVRWLNLLVRMGLGACLADDMGLGKTVQVIALHLHRRAAGYGPTLVVCPTTLLANWEREVRRFAPDVTVRRFHGPGRSLGDLDPGELVVTSYGVARSSTDDLAASGFSLVVADEAQHAKNPASATARALRAIPAQARVALTGTPVENRLSELWAILDWTTPGLLGPLERFLHTVAVPVERYQDPIVTERLARTVRPFLLRRRKTDPGIAPDLPPRTVSDVPVPLTGEQVTLYEAEVREAMAKIRAKAGFERQGLVLRLLTVLKQICNHPAQYLHQPGPVPGRSGKFAALEELLGVIVAEGESTLVFSQFVECLTLIDTRLGELGVPTLFLHGKVPARRRATMVDAFQAGDVPVFLVSLKSGGVGLNLTRATHVVHVDRWWNPAVEDQATDRVHRIGQDHPVQVHRLVAEGTLEDRIAEVIEKKRGLAESVVGSGEAWVSSLSDDDLAALVELGRP